jgi:hypothetical protein
LSDFKEFCLRFNVIPEAELGIEKSATMIEKENK